MKRLSLWLFAVGLLSVQANSVVAQEFEAAPASGFLGGAGLYLVQPFFENNPAFTVTRFPAGGPIESQTNKTDVRHHMEVAPLFWFGYLSESGLGGRVRWWYFRQGSSQGLTAVGTGGDVILLTSASPLGLCVFADTDSGPAVIDVTTKLQLQIWDVEAVDRFAVGDWDLLVAGGLRLAHINQEYNAFVAGDSGSGAGAITAQAFSGHSFHGLGPVVALEAHRPVGTGGLGLYGNARVALLFGSGKQSLTNTFIGFGAVADDLSQDHRNRVLPVAELELGLEYGLQLGSSWAFGQIGLIGQEWWGAGNASRSAPTSTFIGGIPTAGGTNVDTDLGFFGFAFRAGLNY